MSAFSQIWREFFQENVVTKALLFFVVFYCTALAYIWIKKSVRNLAPGPLGIPILGYFPFIRKDPVKAFAKLRKTYGDIFGFYVGNQYVTVVCDCDIAKEVLNHPAGLGRQENASDLFPGGFGFATLNGKEWSEQRRFSVHAMKDIGLAKGRWGSLIQEEVDSFVQYLTKQKGQPTDISEPLLLSLSHNLLSLLLGKKYKDDDEEGRKTFLDFLSITPEFSSPLLLTALFPWIVKLVTFFHIGNYDAVYNTLLKFYDLLSKEVRNHNSSNNEKSSLDFIDLYISESEKKNTSAKGLAFNERNLSGNITGLLVGGTDTTVASLTYLFMMMASRPEIQSKVQNEIDDAIGRDGTLDWEMRDKFPFTFAVITESQRWSTILPINLTRSPTEDFVVRGYTLPKGSTVLINFEAIHHDPQHWPDPMEFRPERFLIKNGKDIIKTNNYLPFSYGKRSCPGEVVALINIFYYFTSVLQRFTVKSPPTGLNFDIPNPKIFIRCPQNQKLQFIVRE